MSATGTWDIVDDLTLRWAVDFVAFAGSGSRLQNVPIISFKILKSDAQTGRDGQVYLVIALKTSLLLYESPKGQRAFKFLKVKGASASLSEYNVFDKSSRIGILHSSTDP